MTKQNFNIKLPLMEDFDSLQGEGFHQGKPAYFIRLGGCDINCPWCDVKESWDAEIHNLLDINELKENLLLSNASIVIVTGGEPLMYNLVELTAFIHSLGKQTHLETAGAHVLTGDWDWICVSPKKFKKAKPEILVQANELKVVISRENDFRFAEKNAAMCSEDCMLYIQPEWDVNEELMPAMINYVKNNPTWRLTLQIHKYLGVR
ncbi:MAG: 7-carboxy-7-deazaguanine synthase [Planctomycetota bacterium]|jgi:7-carboxy-7-deazaguanine synthase